MGCKGKAIIDYPVDDVFNIFVKSAKRDFPNFDEENAVGCSKEKVLNNFSNPMKCKIEITQYVKNEKYEVTTTTDNSVCTSTYSFKESKNNSTVIELEEEQVTQNFFSQMTLLIQRMLAKKQFKEGFKSFTDSINNELRHKYENIERNKSKK